MLRVENLELSVPGFRLGPLSFEVGAGEYFVLLGPSGAGKTLLLECLAGFRGVERGELWHGARRLTELSPESRGLSLVYQDPLLFSHLSVAENIGFALRAQGWEPARVRARVAELAELLDLGPRLSARVGGLSGGEAQRVALARALAAGRELLLLDEPLSALDPRLHRQLRGELQRLHRRLGLTVLHVTHRVDEARSLASQLGALVAGELRQSGPAAELFARPADSAVASALGVANFTSGVVEGGRLQAAPGVALPLPAAKRHAGGARELRGLWSGLALGAGPGSDSVAGVHLGIEHGARGELRALVQLGTPPQALVLEVDCGAAEARAVVGGAAAHVDFGGAHFEDY